MSVKISKRICLDIWWLDTILTHNTLINVKSIDKAFIVLLYDLQRRYTNIISCKDCITFDAINGIKQPTDYYYKSIILQVYIFTSEPGQMLFMDSPYGV